MGFYTSNLLCFESLLRIGFNTQNFLLLPLQTILYSCILFHHETIQDKKKKKKRIQITVVKNSQTIKPLYGCCKYFTHWNPADNKLFPEHYSTFPFIADLQSNRNWKRHWEVSFVCIKVDECERQQTQKLSGRWEKQPWCS